MSNSKRRAHTKKLKEQIPTVSMKELINRRELPEHFHLFTRQEMKEYNRKKNKKSREAFKKRLGSMTLLMRMSGGRRSG